jgi:hypothetical protein
MGVKFEEKIRERGEDLDGKSQEKRACPPILI